MTTRGQYIEFEIVSAQGDHSIGNEIGFNGDNSIYAPPTSDTNAVFVTDLTIEAGKNIIEFVEVDSTGIPTVNLSANIPIGNYMDMDSLAAMIEEKMEDVSLKNIDYAVSYDPLESKFNIRENGSSLDKLEINWDTSTATDTLGYYPFQDTITYPKSDHTVQSPITIDSTNNAIDFEETSIDGTVSDQINIRIPQGDYTDLDDLAVEIQTALREESPNNVKYVVAYDSTAGEFMIKGSDADIKGFTLLWQTGDNRDQSAAEMLGFYGDDTVGFSESDEQIVNITIDPAKNNNKINFREILKGTEGKAVDELTATITSESKTYTSHSQLALDVEKALEEESYENGNHIDYAVTWDSYTKNFTIKENGTELEGFDLLWQTGENAPVSAGGDGGSIGEVLGFDIEDDIAAPVESDREVEWGIFNTLIDLNQYLSDNDAYGIERTLGRLDAHFDSMTSKIVDVGNKYNRLEIRDKITTENSLSLKERKSTIEDADIVEAIMNLQAIEAAYQASLSSTAKIMNLSLVDYL